jgi:membrane carboxypeptidase/penicillin-binding protein PbpC
VHREIRYDPTEGVEVCPACARGRPFQRRIVEVWPPEVELSLARAGVVVGDSSRALPPHDPRCSAPPPPGGEPRILYPQDGTELLLRGSPGSGAGDRIFFSAAASRGVSRLHWFLDGNHLAMASPEKDVAWTLSRGRHRLRCVDERGRATTVEFVVR